MTDITIRNQSPYTTPNGGASGTDGTTAPKKTENTTGNGVTGNDGDAHVAADDLASGIDEEHEVAAIVGHDRRLRQQGPATRAD